MNIRGITVTGNTRQQAEDSYRAVATGKSVKAFANVDNEFVVLSSADSEISPFNPLTGDADMVEASSVIEQLEFKSESSANVETNYVVCSSGCGVHIITDDAETRFCPACSEALPDDDCDDCDEQSQNQINSNQIVVAADSAEEAIQAFSQIAQAGATTAFACGDVAVASNLQEGEFVFSPFQGDENIQTTEVAMAAVASADGEPVEAHQFVCINDDCRKVVVASTDDPVFCPCCSSGLVEPEEDQAALSSDDEDDEDMGEDMGEEEESEEEDESEEESDDEESEEESEEEDESEEESDDEESEDDLDEEEEDDSEAVAATVHTVETSNIELPMLQCVAGSDNLEAEKLEAAYVGEIAGNKTVVAFYDGVPVATATDKTVAAFADIIDSPQFGRALCSAASEIGVEKALTEMGFQDIKPQIAVETAVEKKAQEEVNAKVEEIRTQAETQAQDYAQRFQCAVATAAQGINANFFKEVSNPIITALAGSLTAIGVQNADAIVRNVFNQHNDNYVKSLIAKASQIMTYDLKVQNDLAEVIAGSGVQKETLSLGTPVTANVATVKHQQEAVASADDFSSRMNMALFSLGSRR